MTAPCQSNLISTETRLFVTIALLEETGLDAWGIVHRHADVMASGVEIENGLISSVGQLGSQTRLTLGCSWIHFIRAF